MKKLLFGITSLTLGGAERVLVDLANKLSEKYEVTIFTIYSNGELEKQLNKNVKTKALYNVQYKDLTGIQKIIIPLRILIKQKRIYKKYICADYDVEIAFLEGPITRLLSTRNDRVKKIAWIHNDISLVFGNGIKSKIKKYIDNKIYSKYEKLVFVSKDNREKFEKIYKNNTEKEVIYNYIDKQQVIEKSKEECEICFDDNKINFLTVARLVPQKAIDRLINIHAKLIKEGVQHNIFVIGDGPEKDKLRKMIEENEVGKTFNLLGKKENPYPYIKNADYFCLLSKFEGYGMVLEEAKILGKPIIITNTAAREAVENYENSIIIENTEEEIYKKLKKIIEGNIKLYKNEKIEYNNSEIIEKIEKLIG